MNVRLTFPALVAAMLIAGSAYAGTSTMSGHATTSDVDRIHQEMTLAATDRCTTLESQWNSVKNQHKTASGFAQAEKYPLRQVWTVVEGEDGNWWALTGFHIVNRLFYLVSEQEWTDADTGID